MSCLLFDSGYRMYMDNLEEMDDYILECLSI